MLEKQLPNNVDTERAILGGIILSNKLADSVALQPDDFYLATHKKIFTAMLELSAANVEISPVTLASQLGADLAAVGGITYLSNLTHGVPQFSNVTPYVTTLKDKSALRKLAKLGDALTARALEEDETPGQIAAFVEEAAAEIRARSGAESAGFAPLPNAAGESEAYLEKLHHGDSSAILTGYSELDKVTRGGIQPGDLWVIASLTGKGKSAWAIGAARQQAERGVPVAFVSREMSTQENFNRIISAVSKVPVWAIKPGISTMDYDLLRQWLPVVGKLPIWMNSRTSNIFEIRSQVRDLVRREGVRTLFVDYLQLLSTNSDSKNSTRAQEVATVSRVLKEIAMDCGIGVFALAQFNRYAAHGERPEIHHLAESSGIEKDASLVLILDMEEQTPGVGRRNCKMRIAKHRNGPLLTLDYVYNGDILTFESAA